jgi:hypothetical protein
LTLISNTHFSLSHTESGGNPSSAVMLQSTSIENEPAPDDPLHSNFCVFRKMVTDGDADVNYKRGEDNSLLCLGEYESPTSLRPGLNYKSLQI